MSAITEWIQQRRDIRDSEIGACAADAHATQNKTLAALQAVMEVHRESPVYEPADSCQDPDEDHQDEKHTEADDGTLLCEDMPVEGTVCSCCLYADGEQAEWPCDTYRVIADALGVEP